MRYVRASLDSCSSGRELMSLGCEMIDLDGGISAVEVLSEGQPGFWLSCWISAWAISSSVEHQERHRSVNASIDPESIIPRRKSSSPGPRRRRKTDNVCHFNAMMTKRSSSSDPKAQARPHNQTKVENIHHRSFPVHSSRPSLLSHPSQCRRKRVAAASPLIMTRAQSCWGCHLAG